MINSKISYRISNKWDDKTKSFSQEYEFEDKGNYATGRITWSVPKKDKQGKVTFVNSALKFICFGDAKNFIASNLGSKFNIEANLCNESFTNQKGEKISFWQLTIFEANLAEIKAKKEVKEPETQEDLDDNIPF